MEYKDSFIFYRSFYDAMQTLPKDAQCELFNAICQYCFSGLLPKLNGSANGMWVLIKPQLDANNKRFIDGKKGAVHGKKGGRPTKKIKEENPTGVITKNPIPLSPETPVGLNEETPNVNANVNQNENNNVNAKDNKKVIPDWNEFKEYALSNTPNVDIMKLELKYKAWKESNWKTGNDKPIKNWKSTLLNTLQFIQQEEKPVDKSKVGGGSGLPHFKFDDKDDLDRILGYNKK